MIVTFTTQPISLNASEEVLKRFKRHSDDIQYTTHSVSDISGEVFCVIQGYAEYTSSLFDLADDLGHKCIIVSMADGKNTYTNQ